MRGERIRGESLLLGNFTQEHENLPREKTPTWLFHEVAGIYEPERIRMALRKFYLEQDVERDRIADLSPGERARLLLALYSELGVIFCWEKTRPIWFRYYQRGSFYADSLE